MVVPELITVFKGVLYLIIACVVGYGVMLIDKKFLNPDNSDDEILYKEEPDMLATESDEQIWKQYQEKYGAD
jgi:hypothetical protein